MQTTQLNSTFRSQATTFEERREQLTKGAPIGEIKTLLEGIDRETGREGEKGEIYRHVLNQHGGSLPVVTQCLSLLASLGDVEVRKGVDVVLAHGSLGEFEAAYIAGLKALMKVKEILAADLAQIAVGMFGDSARLRSEVQRALTDLDRDTLTLMIERNELNLALQKSFARQFGMSLLLAMGTAEVIASRVAERTTVLSGW
jgi:hypothetical protein